MQWCPLPRIISRETPRFPCFHDERGLHAPSSESGSLLERAGPARSFRFLGSFLGPRKWTAAGVAEKNLRWLFGPGVGERRPCRYLASSDIPTMSPWFLGQH